MSGYPSRHQHQQQQQHHQQQAPLHRQSYATSNAPPSTRSSSANYPAPSHSPQQSTNEGANQRKRKLNTNPPSPGASDPNLAQQRPPQQPQHQVPSVMQPSPQGNQNPMDDDEDDKAGVKENKGGASDFVKKLYGMLEDPAFQNTVSWGYTGDSFVVKDMNKFTKDILPLHFKHSNFASFVRQLNKYDFHKVKNPEDTPSPYGEHTWEFRHPQFRVDMKASLDTIKRKAPAPRKVGAAASRQSGASASSMDTAVARNAVAGDLGAIQQQLDQLHHAHSGMSRQINNLSQDYQSVIGEMVNFQRNMVAQDQLMQNLIQYLINLEADQKASSNTGQDRNAPFQPSSQAQKLISSYTEVARASYDQMADLSRRASLSGGQLPQIPLPPPEFGQLEVPGYPRMRRDDGSMNGGAHDQASNAGSAYDSRDNRSQQGAGPPPQQTPKSQAQARNAPPQHSSPQQQQAPPQSKQSQASSSAGIQHPDAPPTASAIAARRQTYVPGWAVPPRVLLVEDDAVCRKLSSKFLEVFGCQIDVAVDGVSAVNKMNVQKYDLVLMDIVMPNLDGVSATSLIRQFDPMTPIISMTSNSGPNDIMTYFSHGMNDILPKPFTKEGLLGMLEKHLMHLKVMQQMAEIPRALGFTDNQIQDALAGAVSEEGSINNPFSAMGISDNDYVEMLQGIALEKEGKRGLEVVHGDEREGKRARFQEVTGITAP